MKAEQTVKKNLGFNSVSNWWLYNIFVDDKSYLDAGYYEREFLKQ